MKWFWRLLALGIFGVIGFGTYDYYRAGLHSLPTLNEGEFWLSFKNGFRAIMVDQTDFRPERVYAGVPSQVASWMEDVWSYCRPLSDDERAQATGLVKGVESMRPEALCTIEVDGKKIARGVIFSRPNL